MDCSALLIEEYRKEIKRSSSKYPKYCCYSGLIISVDQRRHVPAINYQIRALFQKRDIYRKKGAGSRDYHLCTKARWELLDAPIMNAKDLFMFLVACLLAIIFFFTS